jgi:hypothetical protein
VDAPAWGRSGDVNRTLRNRLLALAAKDLETRERLAENDSLFDRYHPEMQAVHEANASELRTIIEAVG